MRLLDETDTHHVYGGSTPGGSGASANVGGVTVTIEGTPGEVASNLAGQVMELADNVADAAMGFANGFIQGYLKKA